MNQKIGPREIALRAMREADKPGIMAQTPQGRRGGRSRHE